MLNLAFVNLSDWSLIWGLNVLVQSALVAAVSLLISTALVRQSAIRHGVLFSGLLLVMLTPLTAGALQWSGRGLVSVTLSDRTSVQDLATGTSPQTRKNSSEVSPLTAAQWRSLAFDDRVASGEKELPADPLGTSPLHAPTEESELTAASTAIPPTSGQISADTLAGRLIRKCMPPLLAVWSIGAILLLIRLWIGWGRLAMILSTARPNTDPELAEALVRATRSLPAAARSQGSELVVSNRVTGPLAAGFWRPRILIPERLIGQITPDHARDIVLHELAHIVRRDQFVVLIQNLVAALFWIHPLVCWLNRCLAQSREEICDNHVLRATDRTAYSRNLLTLAQMIQPVRPLQGTVGLFNSHWRLEQRVAGLLDAKRNLGTHMTWMGRAVVVAIFFSMIVAISLGTLTAAAAQQPNVAAEKPAPANQTQSSDKPAVADKAPSKQAPSKNLVQGRILNDKGQPVVGARVSFGASRMFKQWGTGKTILATVSDENGRYQFNLSGHSAQGDMGATVIAHSAGMGLAWRSIKFGPAADIDLTLPPQQSIQVQFTDSQGAPAPKLSLRISGIFSTNRTDRLWFDDEASAGKFVYPPLQSDANGVLTLPSIPPDQGVELVVQGTEQFAPQLFALNTGIPEERPENDATYRSTVKNTEPGKITKIPLAAAQLFEGVVLLGNSNRPAANAKISIWASQQDQSGSMITVDSQTDANGHFRLNPYPGVRFGINAYPPEGEPYLVREIRDLKWQPESVAAGQPADRDDVATRLAQKYLELAQIEYQRALQANRLLPGTVAAAEIRRLNTAWEQTVLDLQAAEKERDQRVSQTGSKNLQIHLPYGILVEGTVFDAKSSAPVAGATVQYHREPDNKLVPENIITGWQDMHLTNDKGRFQITVPRGPGTLLVHAPTGSNYVLQMKRRRELDNSGRGGLMAIERAFMSFHPGSEQRYYAHAFLPIDAVMNTRDKADALEAKLQPGGAVVAQVVDPSGKPVESAVCISPFKVHPTEPTWRPILDEVVHSHIEILGVGSYSYPVFFLDQQRRLGAVAMVSTENPRITVQLKPCASAKVRFVTEDGKPVPAGHFLDLHMVVTPGPPKHGFLMPVNASADEEFVSWIDEVNYKSGKTGHATNSNGEVFFSVLIPGATYRYLNNVGNGRQVAQKEFVAESDKMHDLGQITVRLKP